MKRATWVAVLAGLASCAASAGPTGGVSRAEAERGQGCFLGSSDPMLRAPDAWEAAAEAALAEAARALIGARVRSGEMVAPCEGCGGAVTLVETRGVLRGVTVVGWWQDPGGPGRAPGTVWAVACTRGREAEATGVLPGAFRGRGMPDWLRRPRPGCAVGLSGPTLAPDDAVGAARGDARRRLAMAIEAEVDAAFVEVREAGRGPRGTWDFPGVRPTPGAVDAVRAGAEDGPAWVDAAGGGPLRSRGLAYAIACLGRPRAAREMHRVGNGSRGRDISMAGRAPGAAGQRGGES